MQAQIVLRKVTAAAVNLISLRDTACSHFDARADGEAVALRTREFKTDPVTARNAVIPQNHRGPVNIADDDIHVSIVE